MQRCRRQGETLCRPRSSDRCESMRAAEVIDLFVLRFNRRRANVPQPCQRTNAGESGSDQRGRVQASQSMLRPESLYTESLADACLLALIVHHWVPRFFHPSGQRVSGCKIRGAHRLTNGTRHAISPETLSSEPRSSISASESLLAIVKLLRRRRSMFSCSAS